VGCGNFAKVHSRTASALSDRITLYFASRQKEKAEIYAHEFGGQDAFGSYEAAAADPRVTALLFCTPHSLHHRNLELASYNRKHVLMEKPIATTLPHARAMARQAKSTGIRFMVAENYRYMRTVQTTRNMILQGLIGSLQRMEFHDNRSQDSIRGWRLSSRMSGGGSFMDSGIHQVSILRMLAGDPLYVTAISYPQTSVISRGRDILSLSAIFNGGVTGTIEHSRDVSEKSHVNTFLAVGTEGSISFDFYDCNLHLNSSKRREIFNLGGDPSGLDPMLNAFLDLVAYGHETETPPEEGIKDLQVVLEAYGAINRYR